MTGATHDRLVTEADAFMSSRGLLVRREVVCPIRPGVARIAPDLVVYSERLLPLAVIEAKTGPRLSKDDAVQLDRYQTVLGPTFSYYLLSTNAHLARDGWEPVDSIGLEWWVLHWIEFDTTERICGTERRLPTVWTQEHLEVLAALPNFAKKAAA